MRRTTDGQKLPNFEAIVEILIRRGLASSAREAAEMVGAGHVLVQQRGQDTRLRFATVTCPTESFRYNEPVKVLKAEYGTRKKRTTRRQPDSRGRSCPQLDPITGYDIQFLRACGIAIEPIGGRA